ncbi:hypothetical protein [Arthrobacter sp. 135MFCol5.1]|uniref:hypothetical protein n=1 Tax=Arthrobacter sp. 135MFCol5.1 TaxID=1158050 RepID=UPI00037AF6E0|nr:hypothetical protein [Arthrobacter sp. 135MFCol5.1]
MFVNTTAGEVPIKVRIAKHDDFEELPRIYGESSFAHYPPLHKALLITPQNVAILAQHNVLLVAEVAGKVTGAIGISAEKNHVTPGVEPGEMQAFWYGKSTLARPRHWKVPRRHCRSFTTADRQLHPAS